MINDLKVFLRRNTRLYSVLKKILQPAYNRYVICRISQKLKKRRRLIRTKGFTLLNRLHDMLTDKGITYFIDFGTLLGIIREGGFIKHDLDIDIGVIKQDNNTPLAVKDVLLENGCKLLYEYVYEENIVEHSLMYNDIKFDICYYDQTENDSQCYLFYTDDKEIPEYPVNHMSVVRMTYERISGVEIHKVGKFKFNIPNDAEKLLEQKYGKEWRVPDSKWVYWKTPTDSKCEGFGIQRVSG